MTNQQPSTSTRHGRSRAAVLATALAVTMTLTGCPAADQEPTPSPAPAEPGPDAGPGLDPAPPDGVALGATCTNTEHGFQVEYPAGWVVNKANGLPPCSAFDPYDPSMPTAGELPAGIAIVIRREEAPFDRVTDFEADFTVETIERAETTVDGRRAIVAELEHTGAGMYPEGQRQYGYYVNVPPHTVHAVTHALDAADPPPYDERKRILDAMMSSLRVLE
jgi:hypothetical protein